MTKQLQDPPSTTEAVSRDTDADRSRQETGSTIERNIPLEISSPQSEEHEEYDAIDESINRCVNAAIGDDIDNTHRERRAGKAMKIRILRISHSEEEKETVYPNSSITGTDAETPMDIEHAPSEDYLSLWFKINCHELFSSIH